MRAYRISSILLQQSDWRALMCEAFITNEELLNTQIIQNFLYDFEIRIHQVKKTLLSFTSLSNEEFWIYDRV
jgi:hypothetical protein